MSTAQFKVFVDELMKHIPEDKREAARSLYSKTQDTAATLDSAIAQVNQTATQQRQWWESNKDAVEERNRLKTELATRGDVRPGITDDDLAAKIAASRNEMLETGLGLMTVMSEVSANHQREFGEPLVNIRELTQKAIDAKMPLDQFYNQSVATRRAERQEADIAAKIAKAREEAKAEGIQEGLKAAGKALPYPTGSMGSQPTTLAGLRKPADGAANPYSIEAAVATAVEIANQQNR